jgi:hypothetical protein
MSDNDTGQHTGSSGGGCGCLSIILFVMLVWALVFGVTIDGRHYGISCSMARGVEVSR